MFVRGLDPGCVGARDAKVLIELFGEMTRLRGAGVTLLAPRVADTKVWADDGARTPAEWMSRATGAPMGQAIGMLETQLRICADHHDLITHRGYQLQGSHQTGWHLQAPERAPPPDTG